MKGFAIAIAFVFVVGLSGAATAQTPPGTPDNDVVKISTSLIQLDVTVVDKKGSPVTDLTRDEIEVYENGKKQVVTNLSFIGRAARPAEASPPKASQNAAPVPPSAIRPENVQRTIAIVVDDLTLSFTSTYYARRALKKFVDTQMLPGDLVAIVRTGAGIGALQQFTNDKRQLYAAIDRVRWNSLGSGRIGAFAPLESRLPAEPTEEEEEPGTPTDADRERETQEFRESIFATGTLGAIGYVVRGMQELPGRKSVMLLSEGFRLLETEASGHTSSGRVYDALRVLIDEANRASVTIYSIDPRGLVNTGLSAADDTGGRTDEQLRSEVAQRGSDLIDTQDGLRSLAQETGGFAIVNDNDISGGIRKVLDDQSYYLVAYDPGDETFDPTTRRFNTLTVKVTRPGTTVRYRSGFFGVTDEAMAAGPRSPKGDPLLYALNSPFAVNDIPLRLNALFASDGKGAAILRTLTHVTAKDITFTDLPDGHRQATFDIIAILYGDNGVQVDQVSKAYTMNVAKNFFEKVRTSGFVYNFAFPIKKPGAYQLRIALMDRASKKTGSANQFVEVPDLKKKRLALSGAIIQRFTEQQWARKNASEPNNKADADVSGPLVDTSLRRFERAGILNFGVAIYNSRPAPTARLEYRVRVFREGKAIYEGKVQPVDRSNQGTLGAVNLNGSIALGKTLAAGDYVLAIDAFDTSGGGKPRSATQFVEFEIVDQ